MTAPPSFQISPRLRLTLNDGSAPIINVGHLLQLGPFADVL